MVWLIRRHIRTNRPSDKLDSKRLGPFAVERKVGRAAYKLILPPTMQVHPTFHVSLLEPHHTSDLRPRPALISAPTPIASDGTQDLTIHRILDSRVRRRRLEYLVQYSGVGVEQAEWVHEASISKSHPVRVAFHQHHPHKPH